jgi:hypothetical protein
MHDGQCPNCMHVAPDAEFKTWGEPIESHVTAAYLSGWRCPKCGFSITKEEAAAALEKFKPYMVSCVQIFEEWRSTIWQPIETAPRNATWLLVKMADGMIYRAHWACDLSGEEQPPFRGWFIRKSDFMKQIETPKFWMPL